MAGNDYITLERALQYDREAEAARITSIGNGECDNMEVADSEDDDETSEEDGECRSSWLRNSHGCRSIRNLAISVALAERLNMLDLSQNGLEDEIIESLYSAWSSNSGPRRGGRALKHVGAGVVHFYVEGKRCCGLRSCCRRD